MQRCSESVAALATALARAQIELVNPEKSQVASIALPGREGGERSFRFAPLASGLDIIRKVLGRHEIAVVQTTATDAAAGMINLTTMLAHTSGEWIASDWPVCLVADLASPRRMGAALTYARRYALFTLVGIAGEDDLDAPDLNEPAEPPSDDNSVSGSHVRRSTPPRRNGRLVHAPRPSQLDPGGSALLRSHLLASLETLTSEPEVVAWAQSSMEAKNTLVPSDEDAVKSAFEAKMAVIIETASAPVRGEGAGNPGAGEASRVSAEPAPHPTRKECAAKIETAGMVLPLPRRRRDKAHLQFVASRPCLVCGRKPCDAHHLRFMQPQAMGLKASDEFTVPLCRIHHRTLHRFGDEQAWWAEQGINPAKVARRMWRRTRLRDGTPHLRQTRAAAAGPVNGPS